MFLIPKNGTNTHYKHLCSFIVECDVWRSIGMLNEYLDAHFEFWKLQQKWNEMNKIERKKKHNWIFPMKLYIKHVSVVNFSLFQYRKSTCFLVKIDVLFCVLRVVNKWLQCYFIDNFSLLSQHNPNSEYRLFITV